MYNPEFVQNLYQKLDLSEMYNDSKLAFFGIAVREELTFTHDKEFMGIAPVNKKSNCIHAGTASPWKQQGHESFRLEDRLQGNRSCP